jgi:hypothetical protein
VTLEMPTDARTPGLELRAHRAVQAKDAGSAPKRAYESVRERGARLRTQAWTALCVAFLALSLAATLPSAQAAECEGDDCQGPAPAPEDPVPGTAIVQGPSNPPVHYPVVHKKNPHKPHHKKSHRGDRK